MVTLADVPEVLRELSAEAAQALSPLEIDVGPVVRAEHKSGYRQKTTMIRFRWQTTTVKKRIKHLQARRRVHRFPKVLLTINSMFSATHLLPDMART